MNVHVYVGVCLLGGICGQGWHVFDGNLGREVHEWPVFAHVRLSVFGGFFIYLFIFLRAMSLCHSIGCYGCWDSFQIVIALKYLLEEQAKALDYY